MDKPARGRSQMSNGHDSVERRYNSLERYLQNQSSASQPGRAYYNKDYEKRKRYQNENTSPDRHSKNGRPADLIDYGG